VLIVLLFVPAFAAILRLPFAILIPLIIYVCAIGAYAVNNSTMDIWYMMIFGIAGYLFKKLDYPIAPMVLALVLGDMAESALRQSLIMSQGSAMIFFSSPIAAVLVTLSLWLFLSPILHPLLRQAWHRRQV
jgi:putative tricarboxylic transport membrane protein